MISQQQIEKALDDAIAKYNNPKAILFQKIGEVDRRFLPFAFQVVTMDGVTFSGGDESHEIKFQNFNKENAVILLKAILQIYGK